MGGVDLATLPELRGNVGWVELAKLIEPNTERMVTQHGQGRSPGLQANTTAGSRQAEALDTEGSNEDEDQERTAC